MLVLMRSSVKSSSRISVSKYMPILLLVRRVRHARKRGRERERGREEEAGGRNCVVHDDANWLSDECCGKFMPPLRVRHFRSLLHTAPIVVGERGPGNRRKTSAVIRKWGKRRALFYLIHWGNAELLTECSFAVFTSFFIWFHLIANALAVGK